MDKKVQRNFLWIALLLLGTIWILTRHNRPAPYQTDNGLIFGTVYKVTYQHAHNLKEEIEAELKRFDGSLSPFNDTAIITRINRNEDVIADSFFINVFHRSMEISKETNGAFDITVAPLANVWGFGFKKGTFPDSVLIDSLLEITGYDKVELSAEGKVVKQDPRIMLSCSAVAKGYAVDVIAHLLEKKGISNFMADIGGEVVVRGRNPQDGLWRIGINKPVDDSLAVNQELQTILKITDSGIATSGNYRNYYYKDGEKYAHTIDPRTGYPVQHNILSATVISKDCMSADAYATAFMVMGLEEAKRFADMHPDIDACFIYTDKDGKLQTFLSKGMKKYM
ncbi:MAG: FAD:protein FMN transferase [Bacteroides sp.]|nr:FAD:protein FMN transferase [Bacteroides sp.]